MDPKEDKRPDYSPCVVYVHRPIFTLISRFGEIKLCLELRRSMYLAAETSL